MQALVQANASTFQDVLSNECGDFRGVRAQS